MKSGKNDAKIGLEYVSYAMGLVLLAIPVSFCTLHATTHLTNDLRQEAFLVANALLFLLVSGTWCGFWYLLAKKWTFVVIAFFIIIGAYSLTLALLSDTEEVTKYNGNWAQYRSDRTDKIPATEREKDEIRNTNWYQMMATGVSAVSSMLLAMVAQYLIEMWLKTKTVPFLICTLLGLLGMYVLGHYMILAATTLGSSAGHVWHRERIE